MFDDQPSSTVATPPANLPTEPEDMLAGVDSAPAPVTTPNALSAGLLRRKTMAEPAATPMATPPAPPRPSVKPEPSMQTMPILPPADKETETPLRPDAPVTYKTSEPVLGKVFLVLGIIGGVAAAAFVGLWVYRTYFQNKDAQGLIPAPPVSAPTPAPEPAPAPAPAPSPEPAVQPTSTLPEATVVSSTETGATVKSKNILFGDQPDTDQDGVDDATEVKNGTNPNNPDTDGDGLTDGEEATLTGSDPNKVDTDGDGLSDFDEAKIWHTNPLNSDTDGDGFSDGTEVQHGYNPLGAGKLVLPSTSTAAGASTTKK
jgi:hypothetical protein